MLIVCIAVVGSSYPLDRLRRLRDEMQTSLPPGSIVPVVTVADRSKQLQQFKDSVIHHISSEDMGRDHVLDCVMKATRMGLDSVQFEDVFWDVLKSLISAKRTDDTVEAGPAKRTRSAQKSIQTTAAPTAASITTTAQSKDGVKEYLIEELEYYCKHQPFYVEGLTTQTLLTLSGMLYNKVTRNAVHSLLADYRLLRYLGVDDAKIGFVFRSSYLALKFGLVSNTLIATTIQPNGELIERLRTYNSSGPIEALSERRKVLSLILEGNVRAGDRKQLEYALNLAELAEVPPAVIAAVFAKAFAQLSA